MCAFVWSGVKRGKKSRGFIFLWLCAACAGASGMLQDAHEGLHPGRRRHVRASSCLLRRLAYTFPTCTSRSTRSVHDLLSNETPPPSFSLYDTTRMRGLPRPDGNERMHARALPDAWSGCVTQDDIAVCPPLHACPVIHLDRVPPPGSPAARSLSSCAAASHDLAANCTHPHARTQYQQPNAREEGSRQHQNPKSIPPLLFPPPYTRAG